MIAGEQMEFGYFGKLPAWGDFIHQLLPQDFTNQWHEWLQQSMADARESLGESFLSYYLNCPAWKFLAGPGVCGEQAVAGLTIPSVDRVGRYFNFTIATVLPPGSDPCSFVMHNPEGMTALENLALDVLEQDYPKEEIEQKLQALSMTFKAGSDSGHRVNSTPGCLQISQNQALPFMDQTGVLISHLLTEKLQNFSMWWYGQAGQVQSQLLVCNGLPSADVYLNLLTLDNPPEPEEKSMDYIDQIIAGDVES
jgi:type VI secretion system protein ImpM